MVSYAKFVQSIKYIYCSNRKILQILREPERYMFHAFPKKNVFLLADSVIIHAMSYPVMFLFDPPHISASCCGGGTLSGNCGRVEPISFTLYRAF